MPQVDIKRLLGRLNSLCLDKLQSAVGLAVAMGHQEVDIPHFLRKLCEAEDSDLNRIAGHYGLSLKAAIPELEKALNALPDGATARPSLSERLSLVLRNAWLLCSLELGESAIRSGGLLLALLDQDDAVPQGWRTAPGEDLLKDFAAITAESPEAEGGEAGGPVHAPLPAAGPGRDLSPVQDVLERYCLNFTEKAAKGEIDPVIGREEAMRRIIHILARRRKNNPIIVGDAGVGKTALVEGLALRIHEDQGRGGIPLFLRDMTILGLDMGLLEAGAGIKGEFEDRLRQVVEAIKGAAKPIILFVDEAHTLIGAGGRMGGGDAANLLKPVLARGELRTIAATTWSEYKRIFEKDAALSRRFQPVKLDEPSVRDTARILRGLKDRYERDHGVIIRDDAISAAAELADRYVTGRFLPDKAVDLLDTSAARVKVSLTGHPERLERLERNLQDLERRLTALRRDRDQGRDVPQALMEETSQRIGDLQADLEPLRERWRRERDLALKLARLREMAAQGGPDEDKHRHEALLCLEELRLSQGGAPLVRFEVDPDVVGQVVSDWTGIPLGKVLREEMASVLSLKENLGLRIRGQSRALEVIARTIRGAKSGLKNPRQPLGAFLLAGPSGVGKTETALCLSDLLFGDPEATVAVNMSEFQERHSVSRLIGSPPGYVGYGEGGVLTDAVRQRPYSVVLLDEAEKAHPEVLSLFLQVFDKGVLADGEGRSVDFSNTIIFLTTNLAAAAISELAASNRATETWEVVESIRPVLAEHFQPALLARLTVVPYLPLSGDVLRQVVVLKLDRLAATVAANNGLKLGYSESVVEAVAARCTEALDGARTVDHVLRDKVFPALSENILRNILDERVLRTVTLDVDRTGEFVVLFPGG